MSSGMAARVLGGGRQQRAQRQLLSSFHGGLTLAVAKRLIGNRAPTRADSSEPAGEETLVVAAEEDAVEVLRRMQKESATKAAMLRDKAPPAPPRRSGKSLFFEEKEQEATPRAAEGTAPAAGRATPCVASPESAAGEGKSSSTNQFIATLDKMDKESRLPTFPTYDAAAEKRRRHIEERIKEERKRLLVFRDVGMDLDKPILSRDVFLVFKYFRYGTEFAVDNELERQLRYFNEHAVNELKIIHDSKLMRGPPTLSRKQRRTPTKRSVFSASAGAGTTPATVGGAAVPMAAGGAVGPDPHQGFRNLTSSNPSTPSSFQITSSFPPVRCANLLQYCASFDSRYQVKLQGLLRFSAAQSTFTQYLLRKGTADRRPPKFDAREERQMTTLSPSSFRRPAVVIYSQLGQKFGVECDEAWRRLAYATICPALAPYLGTPSTLAPFPTPSPSGGSHKCSPIDVVSLRSADLYKYRWVHALYVRRLAKTLQAESAGDGNEGESEKDKDKDGVRKLLVAASTFVGSGLLEPFYQTLGLRNYLLPQVMLVDHEGVVRWLSGGLPDSYEAQHFPALLRQLETEYYSLKHGVH